MMSKNETVEVRLNVGNGQVSAVRAALKAVEQLTGGQRFDFELVETSSHTMQEEGVLYSRVLRVTKAAPRPLTAAEKSSIMPGGTPPEPQITLKAYGSGNTYTGPIGGVLDTHLAKGWRFLGLNLTDEQIRNDTLKEG